MQYSEFPVYQQLFGADPATEEISLLPRYNIAPQQAILAAFQRSSGQTKLFNPVWGLVPSWSKEPNARFSLFNARAESVAIKPAFREPFRHRRCLIPTEGFYEWKKTGKTKQPYCITRSDGRPFAFAGLWDQWKRPSGEERLSCTIIVTEASAILKPIHDRMPVILQEEYWSSWLDPAHSDVEVLSSILAENDHGDLLIYPVSGRVNNAANDEPGLITPLESSGELDLD